MSGTNYTAQLFGGATNVADENLLPLTPATTLRVDAPGFVLAPTNAVTLPGIPEGQRAKIQLRVWDNEGGLVPTWFDALSDPTIPRGQSSSFISEPLGGLFLPPPNLIGLQSFNLSTLVPLPFALKINFQPNGAPVPGGYLADSGLLFGARTNGFTYGWNADMTTNAVDQNATNSLDQRYDTFILMAKAPGAIWELAVTNGVYRVRGVAGDPVGFDSVYRIEVEGKPLVYGTPTASNRWVQGEAVVAVTDGRLTISNGDGAVSNRLAFIEVTGLTPPPLKSPAPNSSSGRIQVSGSSKAKYAIDRSVDLLLWTFVGVATNSGRNTFTAIDTATNITRFYRARTLVKPAGIIAYTNSFETTVGSEWSANTVSTSPLGNRHFLGTIGAGSMKLTLTNLPVHTKISVGFDLYVMGSWDGNSTSGGPDLWTLAITGGPTLLSTTFQSASGNPNARQAYPGDYPASSFLPQSGAKEINTLGYSPGGDTVYRLSYTTAHTSNSVEISFSGGITVPAGGWGLDNVVITTFDDVD